MIPKLALLAIAAVFLGSSAKAEVLVLWSWENLTSDASPNVASDCSGCLTIGAVQGNGIDDGFHATGGVGDSQFRCFDGWDAAYNYDLNRTTLALAPGAIGFDFSTDAASVGTITSVSLSLLSGGAVNTPTNIQASLFWQDGFGQIQSATSGVLSIGPGTDWMSLELTFGNSTAPVPSGAGFGGQSFHVEIYASGGTGQLGIDELALNGQCAVLIPEPGSGLLSLCLGLFMFARRRSRSR